MIRVKEYALDPGDGQEVGIRREHDATTLRWGCGESRRFTDSDLDHTLACLDALGDEQEVYLSMTDSDGRPFAVRLHEDGDIHVYEQVPYNGGSTYERALPLDDLTKAFRKLRPKPDEPEVADEPVPAAAE